MTFYIKIHNSPRSKILPKEFGYKIIDFNFGLSLLQSISLKPFFLIKGKLIPKNSNLIIEYGGNFFINFWIILFSALKKNDITIDCHNSAVENEKGHFLRFILNRIYLFILNRIFNIKIIIHNEFITPFALRYSVVETPYPQFNFSDVVKKDIDVLFLCSLNSDEPISFILKVCNYLKSKNLNVKITGNYDKVKSLYKPEFFITPYPPYKEYINLIRRSKKTVSLTKRKKTLLFAPREAISLGVKCYVNNSEANRNFYTDKVDYIDINDFQSTCKMLYHN